MKKQYKHITSHVAFIGALAAAMSACKFDSKPATTPETIRITAVFDRSKSFTQHYSFPSPTLFKPLCEQLGKTNTLDFRYGIIAANSNTVFLRYYVPRTSAQTQNAWLASEKGTSVNRSSDWESFSAAITTKLSEKASMKSDISSAIDRAVTGLTEEASNKAKVRRVLLIATDYKHNASAATIPHVPENIEVYSVGIVPKAKVTQILKTQNVHCFESLEAAIESISHSLTNQ